jgi:hypothetical protein
MDAQPPTTGPIRLLAGRYRLERPLGAGGMGAVHLAPDETLHRPVAVKLLPERVRDADAVARFRREAQALCRGVLIADNAFEDSGKCITLYGDLSQVAVVGNRFRGIQNGGVAFFQLGEADLLVANNTFHDCPTAVDVEDTEVRPGQARLVGNLTLSPGSRDWFRRRPAGPGVDEAVDGAALLRVWCFACNWRENRPAAADLALGRIPPGPRDVFRDVLEGVNRDPKSPTFLRPDKGSQLAAEGGGKDDPTLPPYVGALPPEGVEPWDWERTWRARVRPTAEPEKKP